MNIVLRRQDSAQAPLVTQRERPTIRRQAGACGWGTSIRSVISLNREGWEDALLPLPFCPYVSLLKPDFFLGSSFHGTHWTFVLQVGQEI